MTFTKEKVKHAQFFTGNASTNLNRRRRPCTRILNEYEGRDWHNSLPNFDNHGKMLPPLRHCRGLSVLRAGFFGYGTVRYVNSTYFKVSKNFTVQYVVSTFFLFKAL